MHNVTPVFHFISTYMYIHVFKLFSIVYTKVGYIDLNCILYCYKTLHVQKLQILVSKRIFYYLRENPILSNKYEFS